MTLISGFASPDEILDKWEAEYSVGPVTVKLQGELNPVSIEIKVYWLGVHLGTITLSEQNKDVCINGKIDSNNKAQVCFSLKNNSVIHVEAKVCVFGLCKKSSIDIALPKFEAINKDEV